MEPTLYKAFAETFVLEWNRSQGNVAAGRAAHMSELQRVRHQIERLVDAIVNGTPALAVNARLQQLEARRLQLEATISQATAGMPRLHPALLEIYRARVADLVSALDHDAMAATREMVRGLVEHITLHPQGDGYRAEVRGELAAIPGAVWLWGEPQQRVRDVDQQRPRQRPQHYCWGRCGAN